MKLNLATISAAMILLVTQNSFAINPPLIVNFENFDAVTVGLKPLLTEGSRCNLKVLEFNGLEINSDNFDFFINSKTNKPTLIMLIPTSRPGTTVLSSVQAFSDQFGRIVVQTSVDFSGSDSYGRLEAINFTVTGNERPGRVLQLENIDRNYLAHQVSDSTSDAHARYESGVLTLSGNTDAMSYVLSCKF